jgi:hypothetical protein
MLIMLIVNVLIFSQKKAQSVEYGFFICISEKINTSERVSRGRKIFAPQMSFGMEFSP